MRKLWQRLVLWFRGPPGPRNIDEHYARLYGPQHVERARFWRKKLGLPEPENWW